MPGPAGSSNILIDSLDFTSRIIGIEATFSTDDSLGTSGVHDDFGYKIKVLKEIKITTDSDNCELGNYTFAPFGDT